MAGQHEALSRPRWRSDPANWRSSGGYSQRQLTPQAPASLGQSAAWAALAGYNIGRPLNTAAPKVIALTYVQGDRAERIAPSVTPVTYLASHGSSSQHRHEAGAEVDSRTLWGELLC